MESRAALIAAAREFNRGRYFEAHEVLEAALDDLPDEQWALFIGLIQVAVGYHKVTQQLWDGAARMLGLGLEKLDELGPDSGGVDLVNLRERARRDRDALAARSFAPEVFVRHPPRLRPRPIGTKFKYGPG